MAKKIELGLNTIFFGPPGTGKTYNTVIEAVRIIDGDSGVNLAEKSYSEVLKRYKALKDDGRIISTTFHQSYGYEEFIEGIKPIVDVKGNISYQVVSGAFKKLCEKALIPEGKYGINKNTRIWHCNKKDLSEDQKHILIDHKNELKKDSPSVGDLVLINEKDKRIVAVGVIQGIEGGKANISSQDKWKINVNLLWQNIDKNVRSLNNGKEITQGCPIYEMKNTSKYDVFKLLLQEDAYKEKLCTDKDGKKVNYVFIIDEINRGNISKIFGELITLVEDSKRLGASEGMTVKLPYSGEEFGIPNNVYIIGTMNTADRSIALMDTALRRRFSFEEMMPNTDLLKDIEIKDGEITINIKQLLEDMNEKIEFLYDREHTIGHAYFMPLKESNTIETLQDIFKNKIIPLLQEYFYDDYEKIRLVLGDNKTKDEKYQFIKAESKAPSTLFGNDGYQDLGLEDSKSYIINEEALKNIESYRHILVATDGSKKQ